VKAAVTAATSAPGVMRTSSVCTRSCSLAGIDENQCWITWRQASAPW